MNSRSLLLQVSCGVHDHQVEKGLINHNYIVKSHIKMEVHVTQTHCEKNPYIYMYIHTHTHTHAHTDRRCLKIVETKLQPLKSFLLTLFSFSF